MRKVTFSLLIAFITISTVNAQISKGSNMVGGSIYYNSQKYEQGANNAVQTTKTSGFGIIPAYGIAVRENLVVGADLNYSNSINEITSISGNANKTKNNSFGVGAFVRPYKNLGTSGFYLFLQGRLGVDITKQDQNTGSGYTNKGFNIGAGINPGIAYAVTRKMHIETGLNNLFYAGYSNTKSTSNQPNYSNKNSGFSAGIGLGNSTTWTVGVKFFLDLRNR